MKIKRKIISLFCAAILLGASAVPTAFAAEKEITLDSGAERSGKFISVNETFETADGTLNLLMNGLKPENKDIVLNALSENFTPSGADSLKVIDNAIPDAEKWSAEETWQEGSSDSGLCWAASASNMLWISGWAERCTNPMTGQPFSSEDDVFAYYSEKFSDKGADVDRGIDWFFMGEFFINGTSSHANLLDDNNPEDGVMKEFVSSLAQRKYDLVAAPDDIVALDRIGQDSYRPAVFQVSIGNITDNELGRSGHSVTVAGVVTDPAEYAPKDCYKAIAIIDSDNDGTPSEDAAKLDDPTYEQKLADKIARPNSVTFYPLRWRTDVSGTPYWEIVGYADEGTEVLYALNALSLPSDDLIARYTETEGNRSVADTVDLTIDTAFITGSDEPVTDIFAYERMERPDRNYAVGEPVNINYFVSNRSGVVLDEAYADGAQLEIGWQVVYSMDDTVVAEGVDSFTLPIYPRTEVGQLIHLNDSSDHWQAGDYTVTLNLNPDHAIKEAYYRNNKDMTCYFTVIDSLLGDVNLDGEVDITDATAIQRYDANMTELSDTALKLADVDRDGNVTIIDVTLIQRYIASLPCPEGIGKPINEEEETEIEHKLVSKVQAYQWNYDAKAWDTSYTMTFEYENAYPVLTDILENYEGAEHVQKTFSYTFDGDLPVTRTETDPANDSVTTVEYNKGRVYNLRSEFTSSDSYSTEKYQYGHDDEYFTLVLHEGYIEGNNLDEWKEEADSVSVTTENGLLKRTTNTGIYAKWLEGHEKSWVRFRGIYTIDYDADGIASLMSAVYSDIGYDPQNRYEVVKKNGKITEIIRYTHGEGWEPFERYEFEYTDTEISPARYSLMINYFITEHGGNYYIFNWY